MIKNEMFTKASGIVLIVLVALTGAIYVNAQEGAAGPGTTLENLMTTYNTESNSHIRYLTFAEQAAVEGYDAAASLFRAVAFAEQVRCEFYAGMIRELGGEPKADIETPVVGSTMENLEAALKTESNEAKVVYPAFLEEAKKDGNKEAIDAFMGAEAAGNIYAELYSQMLKNLEFSKGLVKDFFVCPVCGNVVDSITWSRCPICSTDAKKFKRIK